MKRKIAVITGTRAEYGILRPLLKKIKASDNLELKLIVTGIHLLKKYGLTINEIKKDFKINHIVKMYIGDEKKPQYHGKALGIGIRNFTKMFSKDRPDILVVFGDRLEPLAATLAATILQIPIAHIHGGDKTDSGHIDESIRHSITRFAHIHFAATKRHTKRLIRMGEETWRVFRVGTLGLDSITNQKLIQKEKLLMKLKLNPKKQIIICLFHPVYLEKKSMGSQMREIMRALKELKIQTVLIYPNNDDGSQDIMKEIEDIKNSSFVRIFPTLPHTEYINLLRYADVLIGNSSSGIIEAPVVKLAVVNIGSRNVGREHADNVIYVKAKKKEIIKAIKKALFDRKFQKIVKKCKNPYEEGKVSDKIIRIITRIKTDKILLQKKITY